MTITGIHKSVLFFFFFYRFVESNSGKNIYQFQIPVETCRPPVHEGCSSTEEGGGCDLGSVENTIIIQSDDAIQVNVAIIKYI